MKRPKNGDDSVESETKKNSNGTIPNNRIGEGQDTRTRHFKTCDGFDEISELPRGHKAYDMGLGGCWLADKVRSRLRLRPLKVEQQREDSLGGKPATYFIRYLISRTASEKCREISILDISVASTFTNFARCTDGARTASQQWRDFSSEKR